MTRALSSVLVAILTLPLTAQQPRFGEQVEVRLIEIDVVVTDRDGNRVHGLTAADFEILEGKKKQEISNFSEYRAEPQSSAQPGQAQTSSTPRERRSVLIVLDWLPRAWNTRSRAYQQLDALLPELVGEGDQVGVVYWNPSFARLDTLVERSNTNLAVVRNVVREFGEIMTLPGTSGPSAGETNAALATMMTGQEATPAEIAAQQDSTLRFAGEEELAKFRRKARGLRRLVDSFGTADAKKAILYVSHDFAMPGPADQRLTAIDALEDLTRSANAAGVSIYAVRPWMPGVDTSSEGSGASDSTAIVEEMERNTDSLMHLTLPTGGLFAFGPASVQTLGQRVAEDLTSYYSLAYRARSDGKDRERKIRVRAKNPEYVVRTRESIIEKSKETLARETVLARLFGDAEARDLQFEIVEGKPERSSSSRWLLPLTVRIPVRQLLFAPDGPESVASVKIMIVAANGLTEVTKMNEDDLRVVAGKHTSTGFITYSVKVLVDRKGSELSIGVMDRTSGLVGARTIDTRGRFR